MKTHKIKFANKIFYFIFTISILTNLLLTAAENLKENSSAAEELLFECEKKAVKAEPLVALYEIKNISEIISYVDENTLVLFDLDETLILDPKHGYNREIKVTQLKPVEGDKTIQVFKAVQENALGVIGLTSRPYIAEKDNTLETLISAGIPLTNPFPQVKNNIIQDDPKIGFFDGIIFTHFKPKGDFLSIFLKSLKIDIGFTPAKVLFVDDLERNCFSVKVCLEELNIPGTIFHYRCTSE